MELQAAIELIKKGIKVSSHAQTWLDLGAGSGLFTNALAGLLPPKSTVYAIDKEPEEVKRLPGISPDVVIESIHLDFEKDPIDIADCDGILIANALHFVKDQLTLLQKLQEKLKKGGVVLVVEYNTDKGNRWVPYPVSFNTLQALAAKFQGVKISLLSTQPSIYHAEGIYAACLHF